LLAKLEFFNPIGSVEDRTGNFLIAERYLSAPLFEEL